MKKLFGTLFVAAIATLISTTTAQATHHGHYYQNQAYANYYLNNYYTTYNYYDYEQYLYYSSCYQPCYTYCQPVCNPCDPCATYYLP